MFTRTRRETHTRSTFRDHHLKSLTAQGRPRIRRQNDLAVRFRRNGGPQTFRAQPRRTGRVEDERRQRCRSRCGCRCLRRRGGWRWTLLRCSERCKGKKPREGKPEKRTSSHACVSPLLEHSFMALRLSTQQEEEQPRVDDSHRSLGRKVRALARLRVCDEGESSRVRDCTARRAPSDFRETARESRSRGRVPAKDRARYTARDAPSRMPQVPPCSRPFSKRARLQRSPRSEVHWAWAQDLSRAPDRLEQGALRRFWSRQKAPRKVQEAPTPSCGRSHLPALDAVRAQDAHRPPTPWTRGEKTPQPEARRGARVSRAVGHASREECVRASHRHLGIRRSRLHGANEGPRRETSLLLLPERFAQAFSCVESACAHRCLGNRKDLGDLG